MSQLTSAARVGARSLNRSTTPTPRLRVVTGAPLRRGSAVFVVICATLLATGLIGVLLLNTALAQGSFTLHNLRTTSQQLNDAQGALSQSVEASKSPANLARRAADMGMVPAQSAAFLRLSDGKVIGVAEPAPAGHSFTVVGTSPPAPAVAKPAGTAPAPAGASPVAAAPAATTGKPADLPPAPSATAPVGTTPSTATAATPAKR